MFEWDPKKREQNLAKHGVDFEYAVMIFADPFWDRIDDRKDYCEERRIALGQFEGDVFVVTYTKRKDAVRIISAWQGGRKEHEQYKTYLSRRTAGET